MKTEEQALFLKYANQTKAYFEWGCGESTLIVAEKTKRFFSVDNDDKWVDNIKDQVPNDISGAVMYIQTGKVDEDGFPLSSSTKNWEWYSKIWFMHHKDTELVFLNGRFRVACAMQVWMTKYDGIGLLADCDKPEYDVIKAMFDVVEQDGSLAVMKRKDGPLKWGLDVYNEYKLNPQ